MYIIIVCFVESLNHISILDERMDTTTLFNKIDLFTEKPSGRTSSESNLKFCWCRMVFCNIFFKGKGTPGTNRYFLTFVLFICFYSTSLIFLSRLKNLGILAKTTNKKLKSIALFLVFLFSFQKKNIYL